MTLQRPQDGRRQTAEIESETQRLQGFRLFEQLGRWFSMPMPLKLEENKRTSIKSRAEKALLRLICVKRWHYLCVISSNCWIWATFISKTLEISTQPDSQSSSSTSALLNFNSLRSYHRVWIIQLHDTLDQFKYTKIYKDNSIYLFLFEKIQMFWSFSLRLSSKDSALSSLRLLSQASASGPGQGLLRQSAPRAVGFVITWKQITYLSVKSYLKAFFTRYSMKHLSSRSIHWKTRMKTT